MTIKKGLYRHFKGNLYKVIDIANDSESQQPVVIYRALYGEKGLWVRPLSMFTELVEKEGVTRARFEYIEKQTEVLEVATLDIYAGQEAAFENVLIDAEKIIRTLPGYISHQIKRCLEKRNRYVLLVEWQSLEDHTVGFRESDAYLQWRGLLNQYLMPEPIVQHYQVLDQGRC